MLSGCTNRKIACPFLLITAASDSNCNQCIFLIFYFHRFISDDNANRIRRRFLRKPVIYCYIFICESHFFQQRSGIAAFIGVIRLTAITASKCRHCKTERHRCQTRIIIIGTLCKIIVRIITFSCTVSTVGKRYLLYRRQNIICDLSKRKFQIIHRIHRIKIILGCCDIRRSHFEKFCNILSFLRHICHRLEQTDRIQVNSLIF